MAGAICTVELPTPTIPTRLPRMSTSCCHRDGTWTGPAKVSKPGMSGAVRGLM
ncbi:Uncharacterised protein [Mycobacteroides abscessus subsp. abscessus]|nr:Uncharacterised protein [Mycobacteroides abscessus subsp. abscessus]SHU97875.1 Uncharacterised protein [Mycobacteroides abscessus subsp. abscessus]